MLDQSTQVLPAIRRWLPPICLVALMAAVWVLPYRPDCESLAWGDDPSIARVDSQCILLSHYADWLHVIEIAMEHTEQGLSADDLGDSDYQRRWYDRVIFYGPETIALADAVRDSACISVLFPTDTLLRRRRSRPASTSTGSGRRHSVTSSVWSNWRGIRILPNSENWQQRRETPTLEGYSKT